MIRFTPAGFFTSVLFLTIPETHFLAGQINDVEYRIRTRNALTEVRIDAEHCGLSALTENDRHLAQDVDS